MRHAAQESDVLELLAALRDLRLAAEILDLDEGDDLVKRSLVVELELAVLVGDAQRLGRGLSGVAGRAVAADVLAQGLGPELAEPVGHVLEGIRIGQHDLHVAAHLLAGDVLEHGLQQRRILHHVVRLAARVHRSRAGEHRADVDAAAGGGHETDRAHLGEAAADAVGDEERFKAVLLGQLDQIALLMVSHRDDLLGPALADLRLERLGHDQVLAHRLGGRAGLGDDAEAGLGELDHVKQRGHALGIDVVLDVELRAGALVRRQLVVVQVVERLMHGDGAQRGAADAQHDKILIVGANLRGNLLDFGDDLLLVVGQLHPAQPALAAVGFDVVLRARGGFLHRLKLSARDAMLAAEHIRHHVIDVKTNVLFHLCIIPFC